MKDPQTLEDKIAALLEQPEYAGHPLREGLAELYERYREQTHQIERIAFISDRYQEAERDRRIDSTTRYQRQLRQIEKVMRISDRYQHMLRDMNERLQWISSRDDMTGLPNRRHMQAQLKHQLMHLGESGSPFCVALGDVDHFKQINDSYGHDVGDQVLTMIANCMNQNIRETDLFGRWGGEEFLLIFPNTGLDAAAVLLSRLQQEMTALECPQLNEHNSLSISFGLTFCHEEEPLDSLLKRVDRALYLAKGQGRKRTVAL